MVSALDSWSTRLVSTLDHTNVDNWVHWPASQAIVLFVEHQYAYNIFTIIMIEGN